MPGAGPDSQGMAATPPVGFAPVDALAVLSAPRPQPDPAGAGPTADELHRILEAATTVPDHGRLAPWRFIVVEGDGRGRFGDALADAVATARPDAPEAVTAKARAKAFAAPCLVVLVASPDRSSNVPEWEQVASASCCGYAVVLAAVALGLGAIWKTGAVVDGPQLRELCGLAEHERLLGWVNLGSPCPERGSRRDRPRRTVDPASVTTVLGGPGPRQPYAGTS